MTVAVEPTPPEGYALVCYTATLFHGDALTWQAVSTLYGHPVIMLGNSAETILLGNERIAILLKIQNPKWPPAHFVYAVYRPLTPTELMTSI